MSQDDTSTTKDLSRSWHSRLDLPQKHAAFLIAAWCSFLSLDGYAQATGTKRHVLKMRAHARALQRRTCNKRSMEKARSQGTCAWTVAEASTASTDKQSTNPQNTERLNMIHMPCEFLATKAPLDLGSRNCRAVHKMLPMACCQQHVQNSVMDFALWQVQMIRSPQTRRLVRRTLDSCGAPFFPSGCDACRAVGRAA